MTRSARDSEVHFLRKYGQEASVRADAHFKRVQFRGNSVKAFPRDRENSRNNEEPSSQAHSTVLGAVYLCLDQSMTNLVEFCKASR